MTSRPHPLFPLLIAALLLVPASRGQDAAGLTTPGVSDTGARPVPRDPVILGPTRDPFGAPFSSPQNRLSLQPIFFPAPPPVLDAALPAPPSVRDKIWTELAPETNELFYAPLSTRFSSGDLNRRHRQRLDAYRTARAAALAELRTQLTADHPTPAARAEALATLGRTLDPKLTALTTTADELRRDLYRGSLLDLSGDWNLHRNWHLGQETPKRSPQEALYDEFSVLRAAIYYQEGLAPAQRQLLREIVIELAEALGDRDTPAFGESFEPEQVVFFLPHTARFRVPAGLDEALAAEIAAFTAAKAALKQELREALFTLDRESSGRRERALQELATRQAPRLAALESMAERIRAGLAAQPGAVHADGPTGLPPELAARIDRYLREKSEVQRAAQQQAQASAASRASLAEFEARNRARLAALATEARAIRDEVARFSAGDGAAGPKSVEALLADFMGAFKLQQLQSLYADYRNAVLSPGLSPAQRQLLYDAALAALDSTGTKDWQAVPD